MLDKYRPLLSKIIPVVLAFIVILIYRDFLKAIILVPIAYLIFIFRLITGNVHQEVLWISFVIVTSIIALLSLGLRWEPAEKEAAAENKYPTRLHLWRKTVQRKQRSAYFKWSLAQDLSNLFVDAIVYRQGISRTQALRKLEAGQLDLPPDILAYLQISQTPFMQTGLAKYDHRNWLARIWDLIRIRSQDLSYSKRIALDLEPEKIIRYLETYLELDPEIWEG